MLLPPGLYWFDCRNTPFDYMKDEPSWDTPRIIELKGVGGWPMRENPEHQWYEVGDEDHKFANLPGATLIPMLVTQRVLYE